jgi:TRAP-type C4-dicarboxylate transport system permease small subunit
LLSSLARIFTVDKYFRRLVDLIEAWAVLLLVLMVLLVSLGVFYRYVLNASLSWYDEFASFLLVWLTFYGAVVASYRRRHIGFEIVVDKLTPAARKIVELIAESCVLGFQAVLFYHGWLLTQRMGDETTVSLVWVQMRWIYSVLPITGALMLIISLMRFATIATGKEHGKEGDAAWSGSSSQ